MRIFIAGLATETNSFSPLPTGRLAFEESGVFRGDATAHPVDYHTAPLHLWRAAAEARGDTVVESLCAFAQPGGPTVQAVYEGFRDAILADLRAAGPVDAILFALHGAMIAQGCDDCEGDLMARARALAPGAVIGGLLDPHCHLTEAMLEAATVLVAYREYPHTDVPERARELFALCTAAAEGRCRPVMRDFDCRMILAYPTAEPPMRDFVDALDAEAAAPGILSLSLVHGFPWGDHPRCGTRMLVVADGDAALALRTAERIGRGFVALRHALNPPLPGIEAALDAALAEPRGPVVLADVSDNAGGGAPSDATFLLRALLARGIGSVATGVFWDPVAVRICREAGVGATLPLRLGGKCGPMSGDPLDLRVTVRACASGLTQRFGSLPVGLGEAVWIEAAGIDIVVNDLRTQTFHPEAFTGLGLPLQERRIVCVKSSNHYRAGFAPIAARIIPVATPGAITPDFAAIPHTRRARTHYPAVEDPFA